MYRRLPKIKAKRINLGCGHLTEIDTVGVDVEDCGQNIVWDIRQGIPFPDNSADMICSSHFIEHLSDDESHDLFLEILRVLKVGGTTEHICPHSKDDAAHSVGHKTLWNEQKIHSLVKYYPEFKNFELVRAETIQRGIEGVNYELTFILKKHG